MNLKRKKIKGKKMWIYKNNAKNGLNNISYLLESANSSEFYCIDPVEAETVVQQLSRSKGKLKAIINTHEHFDHYSGNQDIVRQTGCEVWAHDSCKGKIPGIDRTLKAEDIIELGPASKLEVIETPGHTPGHICLKIIHSDKVVGIITGDTLFNAGVGNCKNGGNVELLYQSIAKNFQDLADNVKVYPGHNYLATNLKFTDSLLPGNALVKEYLENLPGESFVSTMGAERQINTFLQLDKEKLYQVLSKKCPGQIENEQDYKNIFCCLRGLRDQL
ncbi:MAG: MBL fold metallo-hydrolase [Bacteriovoracaceae bacterium]|nr:MBL fold metallo-hydrolase [Bacteriovoracaceae bacterium]